MYRVRSSSKELDMLRLEFGGGTPYTDENTEKNIDNRPKWCMTRVWPGRVGMSFKAARFRDFMSALCPLHRDFAQY